MGAEAPIPHVHSPPLPPPSLQKSNLPMLYYGLVVVGTAVIVLALYNLIIIKWCSGYPTGTHLGRTSELEHTSNRRIKRPNKITLSSFKYTKDRVGEEDEDGFECSICLSRFEEGEDIRQLPQCKHTFHAPCIDMWLYSHLDCPLCRSPVEPPVLGLCSAAEQLENSSEGLLDPANLV